MNPVLKQTFLSLDGKKLNQNRIEMSKEEAIQAMKEGKKVTHRFFSSDEWMTIENGFLLLEDGVRISLEDFFNFRSDSLWENGYELYNG